MGRGLGRGGVWMEGLGRVWWWGVVWVVGGADWRRGLDGGRGLIGACSVWWAGQAAGGRGGA